MISAETAYGHGRVANIIKLVTSCIEQGLEAHAAHLGVLKIFVVKTNEDLKGIIQEISSNENQLRVLEFGLSTRIGSVSFLGKSDCEAVLKTSLTEPRVFAILRN